MQPLRFVVADVFTDRPLTGNQLAVFTDGQGIDAATMQALAHEIGFAETVFVLPAVSGGDVQIRIFTPRVELPFAGHPVLGTAFVLGGPLQRDVIRLETGSGVVPIQLERDGSRAIVFGRMEQPVPQVELVADSKALLRALGVERTVLPVELYDNGARHTLVGVASPEEVAGLRPRFDALAELVETPFVTCFAGSGTGWKARMFAPSLGIPEDSASGSMAGPLACHLCRHGVLAWGTEIEIVQGVEIGRPSTLYGRAEGRDGVIERVEVGGRAVVVARGEFRI